MILKNILIEFSIFVLTIFYVNCDNVCQITDTNTTNLDLYSFCQNFSQINITNCSITCPMGNSSKRSEIVLVPSTFSSSFINIKSTNFSCSLININF
jgi:hypothetical protein